MILHAQEDQACSCHDMLFWHDMQDARDKAVAERVQLQNTPPLTLQLQACPSLFAKVHRVPFSAIFNTLLCGGAAHFAVREIHVKNFASRSGSQTCGVEIFI